jgi:antitoxin MazE
MYIREYILNESLNMASAKVQLVKWGNSQAVRIPKSILEQSNLSEGAELEVRVENGSIWLEPLKQQATLEALVARITPKNRHRETDWGKPVGNEVW